MRLIVTYDIATPDKKSHKRLRKVAKIMQRYGTRVQNSVFECPSDFRRLEKMLLELEKVMSPTMDSLIVYRLGECCGSNIIRWGTAGADPTTPEAFVL